MILRNMCIYLHIIVVYLILIFINYFLLKLNIFYYKFVIKLNYRFDQPTS